VMVAVSVLCAPSDEEARWLAGSSALSIVQRATGHPGPLPSPEEAAAYALSPSERGLVDEALASHVIGDPHTVLDGLAALSQRTSPDELMLSTRTHSLVARAQSYSLVATHWGLSPQVPVGDAAASTAPA